MVDLFFELVGPNYPLAKAEITAAIEGLSYDYKIDRSDPGVLSLSTDCPVKSLAQRLGLTHRIYREISKSSGEDFSDLEGDLDLPTGSAAVRTRRIENHRGDTQAIKEKLGEMISSNHSIDLDSPDHELCVIISEKNYVGKKLYEMERENFKSRDGKNRPFSYPISLKPRYTRALINLTRAEKKAKVHDPFCGTGGVLIEAYLMGLDVSGGDKDSKMIEGCRKNLREFDVEASLEVGDVAETIPKDIDCIATDPPYGRASSTSKEGLSSLYERLFRISEERLKKGGYLSAIFPGLDYVAIGKEYLELIETYKIRVHRSLDRHFTVFKKI
ncbi:MAG: methyltransferase [Candidatus Thermoplasmatota archaeon]|nr:methyltransferase [Candidatus Thermoplasmatota archaeon]MBS3789600.1 methyltransferase [Candidatus Thermoplasmatota archaeon]